MSVARLILGIVLIVIAVVLFFITSEVFWSALAGASLAGGCVLIFTAFRRR